METKIKGMFGSSDGILAITSQGVRFQKAAVVFTGTPIFIPRFDIRHVSMEGGLFWGGTIHIQTSDGTTSFEFGSRGTADKVEKLIRELL